MQDGGVPGFEVPLHQSMINPVTIGGVARIPAILIGVSIGILVLSLHKFGGIFLGIAFWFAAAYVTRMDPFFFEIVTRSIRSRMQFLGN